MKTCITAALLAAVLITASCKKSTDSVVTPVTPPVTVTPIAPEGFNFSTTKSISVNIQLLAGDNKAIKGIPVNFYPATGTNTDKALFTAMSDASGNIHATISIPSYLDTLLIDAAYIGLIRNAKAVIKGNSINGIIGGADGFSGDIIANNNAAGEGLHAVSVDNGSTGNTGGTAYPYLGTYDNSGRPDNLTLPSDVISSELLSFINTSLPESKPVPTYHPDFLSVTAQTDLNITALSDVWVTFVSEGAGFMNSLGFYTYPTGTPPLTIADIQTVTIAIPNASLKGSGGSMRSGDKINIGRFEAGTSIGFVLFQNAWSNSSKQVNTAAIKYYGDDNLNTEANGFKRHTVLLYDDKNKLFLQGIEDQQRDKGASDNDFNDLIFYSTSNPVEGISKENVNPIDQPVDTDGDGVTDTYDKFPTDPTRAYIQYFPAENTWGTLAYEDLWPGTGDYDLNDLVVGYRYKYINDAKNQTIEMYADYMIRAIGATFINGFGVQFPFASSRVSTVTGQKLIAGYIKTNSNGTETGQAKAVVIPFDDTRALHPSAGFINVNNNTPYANGDTAHLYLKFTSSLTAAELGAAPFNPFLISNQRRGYEIHLSGNVPTDLADSKLFGTGDDRTNTAKSKYYLTDANWPWAMGFTETFDYPMETISITNAYPNFLNWAKSGGTSNADWYKDIPGNRNTDYIYKK